MPEVARFEPATALAGGADGLTAYREIIASLPELLGATGIAILELGAGQAPDVAAMAQRAGFGGQIRPDLADIPRALTLQALTSACTK
jgi:release factor glutamine methyltransferase